MTPAQYLRCLLGIIVRESLRFLHQRERFFGALVRPLVWLFIFAAGFRSVLGVSIIPPYQTYILYEEYIVPGLAAMILLFSGMQSSLSMVYDREMGSMRMLMVSPFPRWYLLLSKLIAGAAGGRFCTETLSSPDPQLRTNRDPMKTNPTNSPLPFTIPPLGIQATTYP